jgi:3-deoxy-D-manno-octulosonic acid (KDO) 8-phosphate synthase
MLCERGSSFGYDHLVVDVLMVRSNEAGEGHLPIILKLTHAPQQRAARRATTR